MRDIKDRDSELPQAMYDPELSLPSDPGLDAANALLVGKCEMHIPAFDMHHVQAKPKAYARFTLHQLGKGNDDSTPQTFGQ